MRRERKSRQDPSNAMCVEQLPHSVDVERRLSNVGIIKDDENSPENAQWLYFERVDSEVSF